MIHMTVPKAKPRPARFLARDARQHAKVLGLEEAVGAVHPLHDLQLLCSGCDWGGGLGACQSSQRRAPHPNHHPWGQID